MMSPGEKAIAVGAIGVVDLAMLLASWYLGAGAVLASAPLAVSILQQ